MYLCIYSPSILIAQITELLHLHIPLKPHPDPNKYIQPPSRLPSPSVAPKCHQQSALGHTGVGYLGKAPPGDAHGQPSLRTAWLKTNFGRWRVAF